MPPATLEECIEAWRAFEIPAGRAHPRVFFNGEEIDFILGQSRIEGTRQSAERERIVAAARALLDRDLAIVREGWKGGTRWACVRCGTSTPKTSARVANRSTELVSASTTPGSRPGHATRSGMWPSVSYTGTPGFPQMSFSPR